MATDADEAGFLSRWSRRKAQVRQGVVPPEPVVAPVVATAPPVAPPAPPAAPLAQAPEPAPTEPAEPPPTLADVAQLTRDSDYTRFVARDVPPDVRNAALGKLFSDPHFNVMDGLDTYIDDYSQPDPLPAGWLRKLAQSGMLGLFDDDDDKTRTAAEPTPSHPPAPADAAAGPAPASPADENTDLQLQPDDVARRPGPEPGAVEDPGRAH